MKLAVAWRTVFLSRPLSAIRLFNINSGKAVTQLGVGWAHGDHLVVTHTSKARHYQRGEHVQAYPLGSGGLQASSASQRLASGQ